MLVSLYKELERQSLEKSGSVSGSRLGDSVSGWGLKKRGDVKRWSLRKRGGI